MEFTYPVHVDWISLDIASVGHFKTLLVIRLNLWTQNDTWEINQGGLLEAASNKTGGTEVSLALRNWFYSHSFNFLVSFFFDFY